MLVDSSLHERLIPVRRGTEIDQHVCARGVLRLGWQDACVGGRPALYQPPKAQGEHAQWGIVSC